MSDPTNESPTTDLDSVSSFLDIVVKNMDSDKVITDDVQKRNMMNSLTLLQGALLFDVFRMLSGMNQYMQLAVTKLFDPNKILTQEETPEDMMRKFNMATNTMQKFVSYAQKFTIGNQELLVSKERREREDLVSKLLASVRADQLEDVIGLLEGLLNGESEEQFSDSVRTSESGAEE